MAERYNGAMNRNPASFISPPGPLSQGKIRGQGSMKIRGVKPFVLIVGLVTFSMYSCAYYNTLYNARKIYRDAEKAADKPGSERERRDKYTQVVDKCAKVINEYPKSRWVDDAIFLMGLSYMRLGEYDKAMRKFREIIENFPESRYVPDARLKMAEVSFQRGNLEDALNELDRFIAAYSRHPLRSQALMLEGDIKRASGDDDTAISLYERAAEVGDKSSLFDARMKIAELFFEKGDWKRAAANYEVIFKKGLPWNKRYKISLALASCKARTGSCAEAIRIVDETLEKATLQTETAELLLRRAEAFECMDSLKAAIAVYDEIATRHPKSMFAAEACYRKGVIFEEKLDSLEAAGDSYAKVAEHDASSPYAAKAMEKSSSIKKLIDLARSDSGEQARNLIAEKKFLAAEIHLLAMQDTSKAIAGYRAVLDSFPDAEIAPKAAYAIAWIYQHMLERSADAIESYKRLIERYPRSMQVRGALSELEALGARDLATRLRAYADSVREDASAYISGTATPVSPLESTRTDSLSVQQMAPAAIAGDTISKSREKLR